MMLMTMPRRPPMPMRFQTIDGDFVKINWYKPSSSYVEIYNAVCNVPM